MTSFSEVRNEEINKRKFKQETPITINKVYNNDVCINKDSSEVASEKKEVKS